MSEANSWLHTNTRRLEVYFRWSLYPMPLAALMMLTFVLPELVRMPIWQQVTLAITFLLLSGLSVVAMIRGLMSLAEGGSSVTGRQLLGWLLTGAVITTVVALLTTRLMVPAFLGVVLAPAVLVLSFRTAALLQIASLLITIWVTSPGGPVVVVSSALFVTIILSTTWLCAWTLRVFWSLDTARDTAARLAVAEERLRFSRDLHDVFGRVLSSVAVKSELAAGLADRGRNTEAAEQMRQVHEIAETAGKEVREVVRGYRKVDFAQELDGARAVLASGGIHCETDVDPEELSPEVSAALGWVVREAVTNVLRHSSATAVGISLANSPTDGWQLTMTNDGVLPPTARSSGSGLIGLQERLQQVGGALHTDVHKGIFTLLVEIPPQADRTLQLPARTATGDTGRSDRAALSEVLDTSGGRTEEFRGPIRTDLVELGPTQEVS